MIEMIAAVLLALVFAIAANACPPGSAVSVARPIYGRVIVERFGFFLPVSARVELRTVEGDLLEVQPTNPFGFYFFEYVSACQDYSLRAMHKEYVFAPAVVFASELEQGSVYRDLYELTPEVKAGSGVVAYEQPTK